MTEAEKLGRPDRRLFVGGVAAMVVSVVAVGALVARKAGLVRAEGRARAAAVAAGPRVRVARVVAAAGSQRLTLLGEARPYASVTLYAKVSGYLRQIPVDKGDAVAAGQVLAVIESPELDQQFEAARADARNKRVNAERFRALATENASSAQEAERYETDATVAEANVKGLETLKSYELIRAPFAGRVIARYADPGALVQNATTAQTGALPILTLSETGRLRVYAYVDQQDAPLVGAGTPAEITVPDRPEIHIASRVARVSGQLDTRTRTLLAEVDLENRQGLILPGSYVTVALAAKGRGYPELPVGALILRGDTTLVAVLDSANRVAFRRVTVARDDGRSAQIAAGVGPGERVAVNLGESVAEGAHVQPVEEGPGAPGTQGASRTGSRP
ncbi:MAG TPA: efflux RND transporter periplasmic adaptor subunit [Gemmatimonadales bacterium]|nr:efflux RND transporter periplasmic adaptor subunit [Gemmatimonadales bacterium]